MTALVLVKLQGGLRAHRSRQPFTHFLRAACGSSAAVAITWASANMPIMDATAIGMLYGVLAIILGLVFLGEYVGRLHWISIAISLGGAAAVMVSKGAFQGTFLAGPSLAALLSATLLAVEGLLIRILGRSEKALSVMLYVCFFGMLLMAGPAFLTWRPIGSSAAIMCVILGPIAIAAQYCTIRGYRMAPLSVVGPVDYSWLIFAALLGVAAFNEVPTAGTVMGCLMILAGGIILARVGNQPPDGRKRWSAGRILSRGRTGFSRTRSDKRSNAALYQ